MFDKRAVTMAASAALALGLAGCSGRTEPATEVGPHSAKLNAYGSADNGPAYSNFRYGRDGTRDLYPFGTPTRSWPAGARGPLSETVAPLLAGTTYRYKVCGGDQGASESCAAERSFTTATPGTKDVVEGFFAEGVQTPKIYVTVRVASGSTGQSPSGAVTQAGTYANFTGTVTCVAVSGNRAAIGAVGEGNDMDNLRYRAVTRLFTVVDGGTTGPDTVGELRAEGSTPPDCARASFARQYQPNFGASLVVQDVG